MAVWIPSIFESFIPACFEFCRDVRSKCYVTCTHSFKDWLSGADSQSLKGWLEAVKGRLEGWLKIVKSHLRSKHSSPLRPTRDIVHQTAIMADDLPIERSNLAASSGPDTDPIPLQNLSSAVDGHGIGRENQQ